MVDRPLILLTNDDGIASPGLAAALMAIHDLGDVLVVAPKEQQTSASRNFLRHAGTRHDEIIRVGDMEVPAVALDASPAQATRTAVLLLAPRKPDLAIAGVNFGENLGSGITISGTVGACIEAAAFGIPALAMSLETEIEHHLSYDHTVNFDIAAAVTRTLAQRLLLRPLPDGVDILNVNVPQLADVDTPWRITRVSRQAHFESQVAGGSEEAEPHFTGYQRRDKYGELEPDSDIWAVEKDGVVSISPLSIDLTAHRALPILNDWFTTDA
jgi:5'-nucleotidase